MTMSMTVVMGMRCVWVGSVYSHRWYKFMPHAFRFMRNYPVLFLLGHVSFGSKG
jgi:hypothetical protein